MNCKPIVILSSILLLASALRAQPLPKVEDGWTRVSIHQVGSIDFPPTMEEQQRHLANLYKELATNELHLDAKDYIVFQQKGLNASEEQARKQYARIMIETTRGKPNEFERLNFDINTITKAEVQEVDAIYKQIVERDIVKTHCQFITWYPLRFTKLNGMSCVKISYTRRFRNNPIVLVEMYVFQNYDCMHTLTLSYRLNQSNLWKEDFAKVKRSFRITNIR